MLHKRINNVLVLNGIDALIQLEILDYLKYFFFPTATNKEINDYNKKKANKLLLSHIVLEKIYHNARFKTKYIIKNEKYYKQARYDLVNYAPKLYITY